MLASLPENILRHEPRMPGVSSPMLYIGMLFSTFGWHTEDLHLYSLNYQHLGAGKVWYGVPGDSADRFEEFLASDVYE